MKKDFSLSVENNTDEGVLKDFVKKFECDGAILIFIEEDEEWGFGRWKNKNGKRWVNSLLDTIKDTTIK